LNIKSLETAVRGARPGRSNVTRRAQFAVIASGMGFSASILAPHPEDWMLWAVPRKSWEVSLSLRKTERSTRIQMLGDYLNYSCSTITHRS
jgi:hypothetical protein